MVVVPQQTARYDTAVRPRPRASWNHRRMQLHYSAVLRQT